MLTAQRINQKKLAKEMRRRHLKRVARAEMVRTGSDTQYQYDRKMRRAAIFARQNNVRGILPAGPLNLSDAGSSTTSTLQNKEESKWWKR